MMTGGAATDPQQAQQLGVAYIADKSAPLEWAGVSALGQCLILIGLECRTLTQQCIAIDPLCQVLDIGRRDACLQKCSFQVLTAGMILTTSCAVAARMAVPADMLSMRRDSLAVEAFDGQGIDTRKYNRLRFGHGNAGALGQNHGGVFAQGNTVGQKKTGGPPNSATHSGKSGDGGP
jgi:hypothetical protein